VDARFPCELVDDVEESDAAENKVSPLVTALYESTDKTSDDHDLINDNNPHDGRPWHAGSEEQVDEQKRRSDEPVDVSDVVDRTVGSCYLGVATGEFDCDGCEAQVGSHGDCESEDQYTSLML